MLTTLRSRSQIEKLFIFRIRPDGSSQVGIVLIVLLDGHVKTELVMVTVVVNVTTISGIFWSEMWKALKPLAGAAGVFHRVEKKNGMVALNCYGAGSFQ